MKELLRLRPKIKARLRFYRLPVNLAECIKEPSGFLIVIDRRISDKVAVHFLIHEFAHAVCWDYGQGHTEEWAKEFAALYRELIDSE
jgi:hypothetical protein